jgi:hypothetical protein
MSGPPSIRVGIRRIIQTEWDGIRAMLRHHPFSRKQEPTKEWEILGIDVRIQPSGNVPSFYSHRDKDRANVVWLRRKSSDRPSL